MDRLEKLSKQVLAGFTEEAHVRRSLEGRRYVTPYLLEQLILRAGQENVCCSVEELELLGKELRPIDASIECRNALVFRPGTSFPWCGG